METLFFECTRSPYDAFDIAFVAFASHLPLCLKDTKNVRNQYSRGKISFDSIVNIDHYMLMLLYPLHQLRTLVRSSRMNKFLASLFLSINDAVDSLTIQFRLRAPRERIPNKEVNLPQTAFSSPFRSYSIFTRTIQALQARFAVSARTRQMERTHQRASPVGSI